MTPSSASYFITVTMFCPSTICGRNHEKGLQNLQLPGGLKPSFEGLEVRGGSGYLSSKYCIATKE
jgi:hypothetical protein